MGRGRGRGDRGWRMSLVGSDPKSAEKARELAALFEKRKPVLKKKAIELSTLCAVPVAVVAALPGGEAPDVWESEEGVLDRYHELPASMRAEHTHTRYLEEQLGKVTAKLARMRQNGPPALAPRDSMLSWMTREELRVLLESVDAALLATAKRMKALGLLDEDEDEDEAEAVEPRGNPVGLEDYQMQPQTNAVIYESRHNQAMLDAFPPYNNDHQMQPGYYNPGSMQLLPYNNHQQMIPESDMMPPRYNNTGMMQPANNFQHIGGNYLRQNQMPGNGNNNHHGLLASGASFQPPNATMQPMDGSFSCTDFSSLGTKGYQMPPQGNGYSNGGFPLPSLEDWRTEGPSNRMGTPAQYAARVNGGNFTNTQVAAVLDMGTGGNVASYVDSREMQSSYSGNTSQNSSSNEEMHYPTDVAQARRQYWEN